MKIIREWCCKKKCMCLAGLRTPVGVAAESVELENSSLIILFILMVNGDYCSY